MQLYARRLVAQRCIYGVDRNPFAVDLAKLSLWLVTLAKDHPFTFVDHTLRQGDSLVGFSREQIASFDWERTRQVPIVLEFIEQRVREAERLREEIESLAESDDTREKLRLLRDADDAVNDVRLIGDALVAAFLGAAKDRERKPLRAQYDELVQAWLSGSGDRGVVEEVVAELRGGEKPVTPFHWDVEFPEIFSRENPGFDALSGIRRSWAERRSVPNWAISTVTGWLSSIRKQVAMPIWSRISSDALCTASLCRDRWIHRHQYDCARRHSPLRPAMDLQRTADVSTAQRNACHGQVRPPWS